MPPGLQSRGFLLAIVYSRHVYLSFILCKYMSLLFLGSLVLFLEGLIFFLLGEPEPRVRTFAKFVKDAGVLGGGSVALAIILLGITIYEHVVSHNVPTFWLGILVVMFFCLGTFLAWRKEFERAENLERALQAQGSTQKRQVRDQLATFMAEGTGIKDRCAGQENLKLLEECDGWARKTYAYLQSIEPSYSARFNGATGPSYAGVGQGKNAEVWNYINRRTVVLADILRELHD